MTALRYEDLRQDPDREHDGDRWGTDGRPVLLLNPTGADRSAWWPVAARLADEHTVAVLDLPAERPIGDQAELLAEYVAAMGTRAPVIAGHGPAALVASLFAARYLAHAVVNIEQRLDRPHRDPDTEHALHEIATTRIRCRYLAIFATPQPDYQAWLEANLPGAEYTTYQTEGNAPHLADPKRFSDDIRNLAT